MGEFSGYDRRDVNHPLRRPQDYGPDGQRRRRWSRPERKVRLTYRRRPVATVLSTIAVVLANGRVLRVPTGFDAETLRRVVGALETFEPAKGRSC